MNKKSLWVCVYTNPLTIMFPYIPPHRFQTPYPNPDPNGFDVDARTQQQKATAAPPPPPTRTTGEATEPKWTDPFDLRVLFNPKKITNILPSRCMTVNESYNATSRLAIVAGVVLFALTSRPHAFLATAAALALNHVMHTKEQEEFYVRRVDEATREVVTGQGDIKSVPTEAEENMRRLVESPREVHSRSGAIPSVDDKIYANRPTAAVDLFNRNKAQTYMDGTVGFNKTMMRPF